MSKRVRRQKFRRSGISEKKAQFAEQMRGTPTSLELLLYARLEYAGHRFERQSIQRGYILDAYIPKLRLAFEADGPLHQSQPDHRRDAHLERVGIRTIRFSEHELRERQPHVDEVIAFQIRTAQQKYGAAQFR